MIELRFENQKIGIVGYARPKLLIDKVVNKTLDGLYHFDNIGNPTQAYDVSFHMFREDINKVMRAYAENIPLYLDGAESMEVIINTEPSYRLKAQGSKPVYTISFEVVAYA